MTTAVPDEASANAPQDLRAAVIRGASWAAAGRLATQGVQFIGGIALARLLTPSDFGLVATVYVFSGFAAIFVDLGIGPAIVQAREVTDEFLSTAFWLNAVAGVVMGLTLAAAGPLLADFFHQHALVRVAPLLGLTFATQLSVVQVALLEREFRFKRLTALEMTAVLIGLAVTLAGALVGWSYYALAIGPVAQSLAASLLFFWFVPWRPKGKVRTRSVRSLWRYAGGLIGFNSVNYWVRSADNLLIGRYVGADALGLYNRSFSLMLLPLTQVSQVIGRVMFPALARLAHDPERLRRGYRTAVRLMASGTIPLMFSLAVAAPAFVRAVLGVRWVPMVPMLQLLCLSGPPQTVAVSVGWLYQALGRTREMFIAGTVFAVPTIAAFIVGLHWGATGVAAAWLIRCWVLLPAIVWAATRFVDLSALRVLRDGVPALIAGAAMAGVDAIEQLALSTHIPSGAMLALQAASSAASYVLFLGFLSRTQLRELWTTLRRRSIPVV